MYYLLIILIISFNHASAHLISGKSQLSGRIIREGTIMNRRRFLFGTATISMMPSSPLPSLAIGEGEQRMTLTQKPKAPLAALIPAAQQRLLLEQCLYLSNQLRKNSTSDEKREKTLQELKSLLAPLPSSYIIAPGKGKRKRNYDVQILQKALPNQRLSGEVAAAALNVYMTSLRYGDKLPEYEITDNAWKKSYIRENDGLPTIQNVLRADLNLRELYKNSLVTRLDDASAELYNTNNAMVDAEELKQILQNAANDFDLWLERIDDSQVKQALRAALEGKTAKLYDSYSYGFVPPR
jgi:hypothetical protein